MGEKRPAQRLQMVYLAAACTLMLAVYLWLSPTSGRGGPSGDTGRLAVIPPKAIHILPQGRRSPQAPGRARVGIVAGHAGFDSGAICPDGLTEASINLAVADLVVAHLTAEAVRTDLLEEFDPQLDAYVASALVSIHADSCIYPEATGFKVASLGGSANPWNDLLVDCLISEYGARTGMQFHANSITYDMTQYHVFSTIAPQTPGAIIETGFMLADRDLLTNHPDLVAQGIVDGILCFLAERRRQP